MDGWLVDERMDGWINGWMEGRMDGQREAGMQTAITKEPIITSIFNVLP